MRKAIILHGTCDKEEYLEKDVPSLSNAHWLPWLQQKFLRAGVLCQILEMPKPYAPKYEEWAETFEQLNWDDNAIIVSHSAGCGFIIKWLHENRDRYINKLVLLAPSVDPNKKYGDFLQVNLDPAFQNQVGEIHLLYSLNDTNDNVIKTTKKILETYPKTKFYEFRDLGHFTLKRTGPTFPDLWDIAKPE